ncbi:hypothetical protein IMZ48_17715 [Candidatus Bathyarchaeota archaeon]|nr:hypothetical protein [Candidatus Bathyarchaeota archaeon]
MERIPLLPRSAPALSEAYLPIWEHTKHAQFNRLPFRLVVLQAIHRQSTHQEAADTQTPHASHTTRHSNME